MSLNPYSLDVSWEAPEDDGGRPIEGYRIEFREISETEFQTVREVDANVMSFQIRNGRDGVTVNEDTTYE